MKQTAAIAGLLALTALAVWLDRQVPTPPPPAMTLLAEDPLWSPVALAARMKAVRPVVEAVTGDRIETLPEIRIAARWDWFEERQRELVAECPPDGGYASVLAFEQSSSGLALTDRHGSRIVLLPENLYRQLSASEVRRVLDLLVAHELAHVIEDRLVPAGGGGPSTGEEEIALFLAQEGYAEQVTAAIAAAEDLEDTRRRELLMPLTEDPAPAVRRTAWAALFHAPIGGTPPEEVLARGLADEDPQVRHAAAFTLMLGGFLSSALDQEGPSASFLLDLLEDGDEEVRAVAAMSVGNLGEAAAPAIPALVRMLGDKGPRPIVLDALGKIGPAAAAALPRLAAMLRAGESPAQVCDAVGRIAFPGSWVIAPLGPILTHDDPFARYAALLALLRLKADVPNRDRALVDVLIHGTGTHRRFVLEILEDADDAFVAEAGRHLDELPEETRFDVTTLLWDRGLEAPPLVETIRDALRSGRDMLREQALFERWRLPERGHEPPMLAAMAELLGKERAFLVDKPFGILLACPPECLAAPEVTSTLDARLADDRPEVRGAAAVLLWRTGRRGETLRRILVAARELDDPVGPAVREALAPGSDDGK